jgi:hypothetical protein
VPDSRTIDPHTPTRGVQQHVRSSRIRILARIAALTLLAVVAAGAIWLSRSTVVLTSGGVYDKIQLPIGSGAVQWRADQSRIASQPQLRGLHGPIVSRAADSSYHAEWFCHDRMHESTARDTSITVACEADSRRVTVHPVDPATPGVLPVAQRIAVVSDIEGDVRYFRRWAQSLGVIDSLDRWKFGTGHVVVIGDAVDRGRDVYDLLWLLYSLQSQATAGGGNMHLILGNHEQYDLLGITKDIEAEHYFAMTRNRSYSEGLGPTTVLGGWLRSRNVVQKIGRTLFVHGGVSPAMLAEGLSIDSINSAHRQLLTRTTVDDSMRTRFLGGSYVTQYRGFVRAMPDMPIADPGHITRVLAAFDVDRIIIGHSEVPTVTSLFNGRVIDVNSSLASTQALTIDADRPVVQDIAVQRTAFADPAPVIRRFSLLNTNDWRALIGVFRVAL